MLFTSGSKTQSAQEFGRYLYSSPNYVIYNSIQFNSASGINEIKSKTLHSPNHPQQEIHQSIHQLEGCNTARATLRSSD